MKKLIYLMLFLAVTSASVTACTEEEVKPQTQQGGNGGGSAIKE
jgi:hypothetical protein